MNQRHKPTIPAFIKLKASGQYEPELVRIDMIARICPNLSDKIPGESFIRWVDNSPPVIYEETPEQIWRMIHGAC